MPYLKQLNDNYRYTIDRDEFTIARRHDADLPLDDPRCDIDCHCLLKCAGNDCLLLAKHATAVNGKSITDSVLLNPGDRICIGTTLFLYETEEVEDDLTRQGDVIAGEVYGASILLPTGMRTILGRESSNQVIRLAHLQVSRRHAEIERHDETTSIRDLGSSNGTYVNHRRISGTTQLRHGDVVGIGPFSFHYGNGLLTPTLPTDQAHPQSAPHAELQAERVSCRAADSGKALIDDISFTIQPGQFVCLLGPTGAGKSTLLRALSNRQHPTAKLRLGGKVLLSGSDLYSCFEQMKMQIAFVPQHEILFDELTLQDSLAYTARLRLPADLSSDEINRRVDEVLDTVQLSECRTTRIGSLSGGQRKRACLANELLSEPTLLFLDEVTSGLDEATDSDMMALFRQIADQGKTVVCVTHTLACVPRDCHRVICLTRFGRLGFDGSPQQALEYFGVEKPAEIYNALAAKTPEEAGEIAAAYQRSSYAKASAPQTPPRPATSAGSYHVNRRGPGLAAQLRQWGLLLHRGTKRSLLDRKANLLRMVQCAVVILLLCSVFGDLSGDSLDTAGKRASCAFILVLSSFWFGCNNAAREIVGERGIYEQERRVVLLTPAYLASKFVHLAVLSSLQSVLVAAVVLQFCGLGGPFASWLVLMTILAMAGAGVGLALSAASKSEEAAMAAVPIVLIPQIILAGAIVSVSGVNQLIAKGLVSSYWGFEASTEVLNTSSFSELPGKPLAVVALQAGLAVAVAYFTLAGSSQSAKPLEAS